MRNLLKEWADGLLAWLGVNSAQNDGWDRLVAFVLVVLAAVLFDYLCRFVFVRGMRRIVLRTRVTWDDEIFSTDALNRACHILSAILLLVVLPVVFEEKSEVRVVVMRFMHVYFIITILRFVNALLFSAFRIAAARPAWQNKPIKGLRQTAQGIALLIGGIMIVSVMIDKSPAILLTGLGASAAIVMLIFRDSILGFVSGIQLSANDMLQVGDWIAMPKYGVDGTVEEVSLNTVKIRNFDNTIVTLPPYLLISDSFQNWRGMQLSGGRRVKRSVSIDMTSVRFCTTEMLNRYRQIDLLRDYIDQTELRVEEYNAQHGIRPGERKINGLHQTNLGVFRAYLVRYLRNEIPVNQTMTLMVRQLQPTETGLPMELYFFTNTVVWVDYEGIQSDVFDHVLAVIPEFDLRVFQNPSGSDLTALRGATVPEPRETPGKRTTPGKRGNRDAPATPVAPVDSASSADSATSGGPDAPVAAVAADAQAPRARASEQDHQHDLNDDHAQEHADGVDCGV